MKNILNTARISNNTVKIKSQYGVLYSKYETTRKATGFGAERKAKKALDAANEFHETHRSELFQFDTAEIYLSGVLQKRFDSKKLPPITKWQEELATKTAECDAFYRENNLLKSETQKVEQIKRSVIDILQINLQMQAPMQIYDLST